MKYSILERKIITISGADRKNFLQGLITNDVNKITEDSTIYTLMLTPQGKFLFDFFIIEKDGELFLDCDAKSLSSIEKRLSMYKLKSDVVIKNSAADYSVIYIFENSDKKLKDDSTIIFTDPRKEIGLRAIVKTSEIESFTKKFSLTNAGISVYENFRIENILPETGFELLPEKSFPLQNNMEELNAIDFSKGCYVGQEVTARSKYRGNLRKKLFCIKLKNPEGKFGDTVKIGEKNIGEVRSISGRVAIAQIDADELEKQPSEKITSGSEEILIVK